MKTANFKEATVSEVFEAVTKKGYEVKAVVQYPHQSDYFLWLVLVKNNGEESYTHHMYNTQDGGLSNGHYCGTDKYRAYETFADRLKTKIPNYTAKG